MNWWRLSVGWQESVESCGLHISRSSRSLADFFSKYPIKCSQRRLIRVLKSVPHGAILRARKSSLSSRDITFLPDIPYRTKALTQREQGRESYQTLLCWWNSIAAKEREQKKTSMAYVLGQDITFEGHGHWESHTPKPRDCSPQSLS